MDDVCSDVRKWEDLNVDVLTRIFQGFGILELIFILGHVCSNWRYAVCDATLWKTIDLSMVTSNFIKVQLEPYVYVDTTSDKKVTELLRIALNLSKGSTLTLIGNYNLYINDDQLIYIAERTPNLKRLVLPAWNRIKKTGICRAVSMWKDLESITMPSIANPPYLLEEISKHCKKFSELKIMGPFDILFAQTLVRCVPNLKKLSLRCTFVNKEALVVILDGLKELEALNISHCLIVDVNDRGVPRPVGKTRHKTILQKGKRVREFYTCLKRSCMMCKRTKVDEGWLRWYKYEEGLWKEDEIKSLAV